MPCAFIQTVRCSDTLDTPDRVPTHDKELARSVSHKIDRVVKQLETSVCATRYRKTLLLAVGIIAVIAVLMMLGPSLMDAILAMHGIR